MPQPRRAPGRPRPGASPLRARDVCAAVYIQQLEASMPCIAPLRSAEAFFDVGAHASPEPNRRDIRSTLGTGSTPMPAPRRRSRSPTASRCPIATCSLTHSPLPRRRSRRTSSSPCLRIAWGHNQGVAGTIRRCRRLRADGVGRALWRSGVLGWHLRGPRSAAAPSRPPPCPTARRGCCCPSSGTWPARRGRQRGGGWPR